MMSHTTTLLTGCVFVLITLCTNAQQGYVFGRVSLYVYNVYLYVHVCQQKTGYLVPYHLKSPAKCKLLLSL